MPLSTIPRCVALSLILTACVQAQPAPLLPAPMSPASGAPTAIATNVGKAPYAFPTPRAQPQPVLSKGDEGAIRDKVRQCWNVGSPEGPTRSVVSIRVTRINPDGTIPPGAASIADEGGSPAWARAALRAVVNPVCQPWPVPQGGWPDGSFILVFDARELF
ncbi:hypothetical protein QFZ27_007226 [Inquilinus ginsengisoli]|uniref:cell envelope integrity protein TolA n=1 Tax=Inquilinus ginsengisoli TaxID=363840 RepID=UPI003D26350A